MHNSDYNYIRTDPNSSTTNTKWRGKTFYLSSIPRVKCSSLGPASDLVLATPPKNGANSTYPRTLTGANSSKPPPPPSRTAR